MCKILVEYDLEEMTFNQLRHMALFLKNSNQIENLKIVNIQLKRVEQRIINNAEDYLFAEIKPKKSFLQKIFG